MKVKELFETSFKTLSANVKIKPADIVNGSFLEKFDYSKMNLTNTFDCSSCSELTTLKGSPNSCTNFDCGFDLNLSSLQFGPKVCKNFDCSYTELTSLEYAPNEVDSFDCANIETLTSLKGIGKDYLLSIKKELLISDSIRSNILGILKIKDINEIEEDYLNGDLLEAVEIINRHLKDRDIAKCRQELIEAGLKEYAKL